MKYYYLGINIKYFLNLRTNIKIRHNSGTINQVFFFFEITINQVINPIYKYFYYLLLFLLWKNIKMSLV